METSLAAALQALSADAIAGRRYFDRFSPEAFHIQLLALYCALQHYYTHERPEERPRLLRDLRHLCSLDDKTVESDAVEKFLRAHLEEFESDQPESPLLRTGWETELIAPWLETIPGMLCPETMKYYQWLGRTVAGRGEIVELGCWMGCSTACLAEGLRNNPRRGDRIIHTYDAFTWMDWMDNYNADEPLRKLGLRPGDSFLHLFWKYCAERRDLIDAQQVAVRVGGVAFDLPELRWPGTEIGLFVMDFADDIGTNRAVWDIFSPSFISGETVIVFNQFGNVGAIGLRKFCRERSANLEAIHKPAGSPKAFLYHDALARG